MGFITPVRAININGGTLATALNRQFLWRLKGLQSVQLLPGGAYGSRTIYSNRVSVSNAEPPAERIAAVEPAGVAIHIPELRCSSSPSGVRIR